jgi:hypothetical protein
MSPLLGIVVGYAYFYLDTVEFPSGFKITTAPWFIKEMYPESARVQDMNGAVPSGEKPTQTTRSAWGKGQKLGSS